MHLGSSVMYGRQIKCKLFPESGETPPPASRHYRVQHPHSIFYFYASRSDKTMFAFRREIGGTFGFIGVLLKCILHPSVSLSSTA
jgi:hypothetical protein